MEASAVTSSSETNNLDACPPELSPKQEVDSGVVETLKTTEDVNSAPELTQTDNKATADKELSWEKIAAEVSEEELPENDVATSDVQPLKNPVDAPVEPEKWPEPRDTQVDSEIQTGLQDEKVSSEEVSVVEETVINNVTEEKSATESNSSAKIVEDVIVDEVIEEPPLKEKTEPTEDDSVGKQAEPIEDDPVKTQKETVKEPEIPAEKTVEEPPPKVQEAVAEEVIEEPALEEENQVDEVVEITELKPEQEPEVEEVVDENEYTVVEAEDVETNEIIEEHIAQTNNTTETVVIINSDRSQTEITIEQVDDDVKSDADSHTYAEEIYLVSKESEAAVDDPVDVPEVKDVKPRKQRGRKPISDIPLHVLGRDITKPSEGVSNGGRTMPKPRLGVKVPYRNLTSQIVSKEEIEKEIMDRFKLKQEQNSTSSGDILFARKLTQRLAKKLTPSERDKTPKPQESTSSVHLNVEQSQPVAEIKNNSDLIAILEGDGDEIQLTKHKHPEKKEVSKNTEKEIALKQLKELPVGKNKIFKSRLQNDDEEKKPQISLPAKEARTQLKTETAEPSPVKTNIDKKSQSEMEPRLKTGMVIKTYTRKRKSTEMEPILSPKKSVVVSATIKSEDGPPTNVYITKSSRVIKRKVIWDPDEVPAKSPIRSPKLEVPIKSPVTKTVEKKSDGGDKPVERKIPIPVKKVISKSPPLKKLKRLTEVDKLLMDEGAVNMLYDVKTNDDTNQEKLKKKNNKSMISLDRAHKELMSKTNVIKNDLQQNTNKEVQKSLRKKEIASPSPPKKEAPPPKKDAVPSPVTRKKSKDSARSSVHSPPASPAYNAAEASRIIRRHSSSSFSSNDELSEDSNDERVTRKRSAVVVESPKKKLKKSSDSKPTKDVAKNNNNTVTDTKVNHIDKTVGQYKTFTPTTKNKLVSIKLNNVDKKCYFTEQVLKELTSCLKELGKDDDCYVVSITSDSNDSFCHGLDYRFLVSDDESVRKKKATELSTLVKEFLRCLLNFPKVLVAGIQGNCIGLGVTMLPLFDMVIASDTSTFSTPYARLGCVPEAGFLLTIPHLNSQGLASELLYTSQIVKADDAFRRGLVTRLCWPEKYHQELKAMVALVANQSRQSIVATKQQLRHHILQSTETSLNSVSKVLIEHWTSPECQRNFLK